MLQNPFVLPARFAENRQSDTVIADAQWIAPPFPPLRKSDAAKFPEKVMLDTEIGVVLLRDNAPPLPGEPPPD